MYLYSFIYLYLPTLQFVKKKINNFSNVKLCMSNQTELKLTY